MLERTLRRRILTTVSAAGRLRTPLFFMIFYQPALAIVSYLRNGCSDEDDDVLFHGAILMTSSLLAAGGVGSIYGRRRAWRCLRAGTKAED